MLENGRFRGRLACPCPIPPGEEDPLDPAPSGAAPGRDAGEGAWEGWSVLRGMRVADGLQQRGLSALFVAVWLRLCRVAGLQVSTHRIDKPLICLVLHRFAFRPSAHATGIYL